MLRSEELTCPVPSFLLPSMLTRSPGVAGGPQNAFHSLRKPVDSPQPLAS